MSNALSAKLSHSGESQPPRKTRSLDSEAGDRARGIASLVYVFGFTLWTLYISVSNSTMLPTYKFVGLKPYFDLWSNARWKIAYGNLFYFSAFYVVLSLARRSRSRHRHRSAREGRGDMADDLSLSARGLVRGHRRGVELAL